MMFLRNRIVDPQVPLPEVTNQVHERGNGEMAGGFAGARSAQAIGDDHRVAVLVEARGDALVGKARQERFLVPAQSNDEIVILVDPMRPAATRLRAEGDLHGRGRRRKIRRCDIRRYARDDVVTVVI